MEQKYLSVDGKSTGVRVEIADSFVLRLKGWMLSKNVPDFGLLLRPCNGIHTFAMRFPIDAVFLDNDNEVLRVERNLKPWRIVPMVYHSKSALELPTGWAEKFSIGVGSSVSLSIK